MCSFLFCVYLSLHHLKYHKEVHIYLLALPSLKACTLWVFWNLGQTIVFTRFVASKKFIEKFTKNLLFSNSWSILQFHLVRFMVHYGILETLVYYLFYFFRTSSIRSQILASSKTLVYISSFFVFSQIQFALWYI